MKKTDIQAWFNKGEWKQGWEVAADESTNVDEFYKQYNKNPERWNKAFEFLATSDLTTIETGRYKLDGDNLFANIDAYTTKNEEEVRYEAHRKYADIQYLIKGKEKIGVVPLEKLVEAEPYKSEKDVAFFTSNEDNYRLADAAHFFIFFPSDGHRPCVKVDENEDIKKVVVKVALD